MNCEIRKQKGIYSILSYLAIFYVLAAFVEILILSIFKLFNMDISNINNALFASALNNFLVYIILFIPLYLINKKDVLDDFKTLKTTSNIAGKIFGGFGIFYAISFIISNFISNIDYYSQLNGIIKRTYETLNTTSDNQSIIELMLKSPSFILMFLSAAIIGPICEELVFRKAFFDIFKDSTIALFVSSLFFGLIHVISSIGSYSLYELFLMLVPYIASGVAFGYIYIRYKKNIWIPILIHMLSNTLSMISILLLA